MTKIAKVGSEDPTVNIKPPRVSLVGIEKTGFSCSCFTTEHHFFVQEDKIDNEIYIQVKLNSELPWYHRLGCALKFLFGRGEVGYTEILISPEDRVKLAAILKPKKAIPVASAAGLKKMKKLAETAKTEQK